ncbi:transmembrane protein 158 [Xenopus laevis]|uniref:Transmembrane protein 158 (gene/pseudogene) n=2 Tax=Xenopus laevis TaxID=8355 RepID=A0AA97PYH8_XENLA|nr:transmembrane protein 158 [Xenopus laevis]OCT56709.1 hypothetical protein XELAEV_18004520mg [Xenopus laevis]
MRILSICPLRWTLSLLALLCSQWPRQGWSQQQQGHTEDDVFLVPMNSSTGSRANLEADLANGQESSTEGAVGGSQTQGTRSLPSSPPPGNTWERSRDSLSVSPSSQQCNMTVQRLLLTSLLVRWGRQLGFQCDLLLFSTNNHGRAFFAAAYNRVVSPVVIEHLGVSGAQQEFRLCLGCGWGTRGRRSGHLRHSQASNAFSFISADQHSPLQGESLNFCCLDFTLEELRGEQGWRMNRKPIESTLVACFMTLVIIVWSVAALIWPVPIIAGFLPNGMEQRRTSSK